MTGFVPGLGPVPLLTGLGSGRGQLELDGDRSPPREVATTVATSPTYARLVMVWVTAPVVAGIRRPESTMTHRTWPAVVEQAMI